jgi:hypothetical protein
MDADTTRSALAAAVNTRANLEARSPPSVRAREQLPCLPFAAHPFAATPARWTTNQVDADATWAHALSSTRVPLFGHRQASLCEASSAPAARTLSLDILARALRLNPALQNENQDALRRAALRLALRVRGVCALPRDSLQPPRFFDAREGSRFFDAQAQRHAAAAAAAAAAAEATLFAALGGAVDAHTPVDCVVEVFGGGSPTTPTLRHSNYVLACEVAASVGTLACGGEDLLFWTWGARRVAAAAVAVAQVVVAHRDTARPPVWRKPQGLSQVAEAMGVPMATIAADAALIMEQGPSIWGAAV